MQVVRDAYITSQGTLSNRPITFVAVDEDACWHTMLYWPGEEEIGLRVLRLMSSDPNVALVNAVMSLCLRERARYRDGETDTLLGETFGVTDVKDLGIFRETIAGRKKIYDDAVDEADLDPRRCTLIMYCYE